MEFDKANQKTPKIEDLEEDKPCLNVSPHVNYRFAFASCVRKSFNYKQTM